MINHDYRCIFVHIPKTAGKSINRFFGMEWQKHKDLSRYAEELRPQIFSSYFKFAIVRNPWDRILSDYNFQNKKNAPTNEKLFALDDRGRTRSFREWLDAAFSNPFYYESGQWGAEVSPGIHRWSPQVDWISLNGNIAVDAVLKMENLEKDFEDVCWLLGRTSGGLPCRNWKFHLHYSHYYDEATRRLVEDYYAKDIAAFGYRFESRKTDLRWIILEKLGTRFKTALRRIMAISALSFCVPLMAQEQNGWQFDSLDSESDSTRPDEQRVYQVVLKMLDCWNAHDIEGHLEVYWKSPELLVVVDSEQFNGWQQLHDSYINGYPDRNAMGSIEPKRIQVKLLQPNLALALTWWSVSFPSSKQKAVGNTTMNLQKFDDGWKIVASHTSIAEM